MGVSLLAGAVLSAGIPADLAGQAVKSATSSRSLPSVGATVSPPQVIEGLDVRPLIPLEFSRAWLGKAKAVQQARAELEASGELDGASPERLAELGAALSGILRVPVIPVVYSDVAVPFAESVLEDRLFGPVRGDTVSYSAYWDEVSGGLLRVEGEVLPWVRLNKPARHYMPREEFGWASFGRVTEFREAVLRAADRLIDFSQFDNDGPDGIPNSGDDDGFVDFVAFLYVPKCGEDWREGAIWPHRGAMEPYETRSRGANGEPIRIADYVILSAVDQGTCEPLDIGVLAHETGHALGLPDLYGYDGTSPGIGPWGLMGTGSHSAPHSPAHLGAWEKEQLGWVRVEWIDGTESELEVPPVLPSRTVYRYDLPGDTREYVLLENRQKIGSDKELPGSGLLAWRIDPDRGELNGWNGAGPRQAIELIRPMEGLPGPVGVPTDLGGAVGPIERDVPADSSRADGAIDRTTSDEPHGPTDAGVHGPGGGDGHGPADADGSGPSEDDETDDRAEPPLRERGDQTLIIDGARPLRITGITEVDGWIRARVSARYEAPALVGEPSRVRLAAATGDTTVSQIVTVRREGGAGFAWTPSSETPWLRATRFGDIVVLAADPTGLEPGEYDAVVSLELPDLGKIGQIEVAFDVSAAGAPEVVASDIPWSWGLSARRGRVFKAGYSWDPLSLRPQPRLLHSLGDSGARTLAQLAAEALYSPVHGRSDDVYVIGRAGQDNRLYRVGANGEVTLVANGLGPAPAYGAAALHDGSVLVADWSGTVRRVLPDGSIHPWTELGRPIYQIAIDAANTLYAAGHEGNVFRLDPSGRVRVLRTGFERGRLVAIAATPRGTVFAAERGGAGRILRFDPDGTRHEIARVDGAQFYGLAVDGNLLYALDAGNRQLLRIGIAEADS